MLLFMCGCVNDPTAYSPESDFTVDEAKQFFESNAEDLRQVGFSPEALSRAATGNLIPEWKSAKIIHQGDITTIEVPIDGELSRVARISRLSSTKKLYAYVSGVTTRLIIQHHKQSGSERQFLVTMIDNSQQAFKKVKAPDYISRSDYSGYIIISSVAGEYLDSYRSDDGKWTRVFMAPGTAEDLDDPQNVGLSLMSAEASPAAYVLGETGGGGSGSICPKCWTYSCICCRYCNGSGCSSCMVVVYPTCSKCGFSGPNAHLGQCRCCPSCRLYPCRCTSACVVCLRNPCICSAYSCSYCGSKYCNGSCQSGGGTTPPSPIDPTNPSEPNYTQSPTEPVKPWDSDCFCVRGTPGQGIPGGLYGANRIGNNGDQRTHQGVDIGVRIGYPVYAIYSGKINRLVTGQPNRMPANLRDGVKYDKSKGYPVGYKGDKDAAGNRIRIYSEINGTSFETYYMHLDQGNPFNLYVGKPVNAGEMIGYTGISGNSYPDSPVLHIQMNRGDKVTQTFDPTIFLPFINKAGRCSSSNCINK